jgi:hypothetical protein
MSLAPELAEVAKAWIDYWRHQLETGQSPDNDDSHTVALLTDAFSALRCACGAAKRER